MSAFQRRHATILGRGTLGVAVLVGLLAVPLFANYLVFAPRNEEIAAARREIESKQTRLTSLRELTARIGDLGREIDARRSELAQLEERLPESEDLDGLLKEITRIAQRSDLAVRTVKGEKPIIAGPAMEVPLSLALEGEFGGLYDFLLALESLPRITRVQSMKVQALGADPHAAASRTSTAGTSIRAEIGLSVYFSVPAAHAAPAADAKQPASAKGAAR
ncbi:MAG: type 4a pilus biosis protein PilO [Planctomycetota bacterium]|jgi:Tfp pilus assembly protein PilO